MKVVAHVPTTRLAAFRTSAPDGLPVAGLSRYAARMHCGDQPTVWSITIGTNFGSPKMRIRGRTPAP
jgi:hypothetical protein